MPARSMAHYLAIRRRPRGRVDGRAMPPTHPHVILICTDDQGYGDIACHGNPQTHTPHLDAMARASTQLDNHHTDPLCSPSRAALMTGRYAARGGVWHVTQGRHLLDARAITLADCFAPDSTGSTAGYRTGMFGKWHLGDNFPYAPRFRGFQEVVCHRGGGVGELPDAWGNVLFRRHLFSTTAQPQRYAGYCTDVFFNEARRFPGGKRSAGRARLHLPGPQRDAQPLPRARIIHRPLPRPGHRGAARQLLWHDRQFRREPGPPLRRSARWRDGPTHAHHLHFRPWHGRRL